MWGESEQCYKLAQRLVLWCETVIFTVWLSGLLWNNSLTVTWAHQRSLRHRRCLSSSHGKFSPAVKLCLSIMGSSMKDVRTEAGGGQAECGGQKRTREEGGFSESGRPQHRQLTAPASLCNRAGQTDVTDTSCTTATALRQSWAVSAETAVSPPLPWHSTSMESYIDMGLHGTGVPLADGWRTIGYMDTIPAWCRD